MRKVAECAEQVPGLFDLLGPDDAEALEAHRATIAGLESEADAMKNEIRDHLPGRLFLPVDRRDLLALLDYQDQIANVAEDVADLLNERAWTVVPAMEAPLREFVAAAVGAVHACRDVMDRLDELVETGFGGAEARQALVRINRVLELERASDRCLASVRQVLFAHEDELSAVSVVLWLRLLDLIDAIADNAKHVCNRLRLLVAR